jgi:hypothetical protein
MFISGGYIFDQRARYSFTVWTSAGAASIIVASNIGWQFNRALAITGGYSGVPGSRSLVNTFPFLRPPTTFTRSREDRFSNLDQSSPENTSLYNSDGVLTFSTGAFAPGVTVGQATYRMWAADGGIKWAGLAVNGQYFIRWLSDFEAD